MFKKKIITKTISILILTISIITVKTNASTLIEVAPKAESKISVAKDMVTILDDLMNYHCNSCIYLNLNLKKMHLTLFAIQEEKAIIAAEEARIEAERIAKIQIEIDEVSSRNNRKNNVHYDPYDLTSVSNITVEELDQVFITKGKPAMTTISEALVDAEQTYGVNAFFLSSLVAEESGWTEYAAGDGDNLTGYAVYTSSSRGSSFGGSRYANIMETARLIKEDYLTPGGNYYNGLSIRSVNILYCKYQDQITTDFGWNERLSTIAFNLSDIYHISVKTTEEVPSF